MNTNRAAEGVVSASVPTRPPPPPGTLVEEYSYVDIHVPAYSERSGADPSTPHRRAMIAQPATLPSKVKSGNRRPGDSEVGSTGATKITTNDVANIFRPSMTVQTVNTEQIQRIEKMHDHFNEGATFTFNYTCLLIIASFVAGLGLISDSATIVVSSMLLSPLMGPVIGFSYGIIVLDWELVCKSVKNELISLAICVFIGLIVCISTAWTDVVDDWPTDQMKSRGDMTNFLVGIPVAFLSGLGVALSILDDQTSSLVGVAVSASLLPPAVNAGLCWLTSILLQQEFTYDERGDELRSEQFSRMGGMSLALTVTNIVLVAISSALMFRIKEVLPVKKNPFWNSLKTARKINQRRALMESTDIFSSENDEEKVEES